MAATFPDPTTTGLPSRPVLILLAVSAALADDPALPFSHYELPNGLDVILAPDHSVPFVWVNVWYNVGSKDEVPHRSGFAHLFEHLMFQGSVHSNDDYFQPLQKLGASVNGTTNLDRTNFFEGVPSAQLPLAVFLESDRMGYLLPVLDDARLQNQKDVVRNERRQRYENVPYGMARVLLLDAAYPEGHPYHIATIGKHEDIEAASLADVKEFFRTWYNPNNASLVICGDFEESEAKALVETYFGPLPRGPETAHHPPPLAVMPEEKVVRATDRVPFEKVWMAWNTPAVLQPGDADLDLLSSALTDGKESRLYKALVRDQKIAQDVTAYQGSAAYESLYTIEATAAAGHTADELVVAIDKVLAEARTSGISADEVALGQTAYEVQFFGGLATIQGKADMLNNYFVRTGNPGFMASDLARYRAATAESVTSALRTWLPVGHRVVLIIGPAK